MQAVRVLKFAGASIAGAAVILGIGALAPEPYNFASFEIARSGLFQPATTRSASSLSEADERALHEALKGADTSALAEMIGNGLAPTGILSTGQPLICLAAELGSPAAVELLLKQGADPNSVGPLGVTCLMQAALANRAEIVEVLLSAGAKRDPRNQDGLTAADMSRALGMQNLARKLAPNRMLPAPPTPPASLFEAISLADAALVSKSLENGADPNALLSNGWTPIMFSLGMDCPDCMHALEQAGGRKGDVGKEGYGLLALAVLFGRADLIATLKDDPGLLKQTTDSYILALKSSKLEIARLLRPNASVELRSAAEALALENAIRRQDLGALTALLDLGLSPNLTRAGDKAPMLVVAMESRSPMSLLEFLLMRGANVNQVTASGLGPLLLAVSREDIDPIRLFLKFGAVDRPPNARFSATDLVVGKSSPYQSDFWRAAGDKWREEAIARAVQTGNANLIVKLAGSAVTSAQVVNALRANQQEIAATLITASSFSRNEVEHISLEVATRGDERVIDSLTRYIDIIWFRDFLPLYDNIQRRKLAGQSTAKFKNAFLEWQALLFARDSKGSFSIDANLSNTSELSKVASAEGLVTTSLGDARRYNNRMGIVCNAFAGKTFITTFDSERDEASGYYGIEQGRCLSLSGSVGVAVGQRQLGGFAGTASACQPTKNEAFTFKAARVANECIRQGGRMGTYYMFGDKLGKPIVLK